MAYFDLMSVREIIDSAFGETDSSCPVDLNMVGSVLFILARRMQLLKRHFKVQMSEILNKDIPNTTYIVTEIKIHTKKKSAKYKAGVAADEFLPSDKILTGKINRSTRKRSRKTSLHRTPSAKHAGDDSSSGMSSDGDVFTTRSAAHKHSSKKYTSARNSHAEQQQQHEDYAKDISPGARRKARKYLGEKRTAKQRESGKYSDEMSPTRRRKMAKYSDETFISDRRKTGKYSDEMSSSRQRESGKYSDEMSPTRRRKMGKYSDETSVSDRRKAGKYSDEMSSSRQRKSGKYSDDMSPDERNKYSGMMSPAERRRGGKYSGQMSPYERSKSYSPSEFSSESAISGKSRSISEKRFTQRGKSDELHSQKDTAGRGNETGSNGRKSRHGARHTYDNDDDMEEQHEKIFVVTRTPSGRNIREPVVKPVVTQEQFNGLLKRTRVLQNKFGITNKSNTKWDDLRNSTSITHPKAALNMAVRLDIVQSRLARMLDIVKQMAHQVPGIDVDAYLDENSLPPDTHGNLNVQGPVATTLSTPGAITTRDQVATPLSTPGAITTRDQHLQTFDTDPEYVSMEPETGKPKDMVTHGQFIEELRRMRDGIAKTVQYAIKDADLDKCDRTISSTEVIVNHFHSKFSDIAKLNLLIDEFGRKVVAVDERLTFEMTTFQDNLMQMQTELEVALEKMTDAFLAPKEDQAAVAQITGSFIDYNKDLIRTGSIQIRLKEQLEAYQKKMKNVEERIKVLLNRKCTRDEMFEALNDKLTLRDINGILTENQFNAVNTEIKNILHKLHLAIFTKECDWQRIIDEIKGKIQESAESNQLKTLMESMRKCFTTMDKHVDGMVEIVGPLKISPTDKRVERGNYCLCCGTPAETKKTKLSLKVWQETFSKSDAVKLPKEEIAVACIPGQPIPHPLERDSFVCEHDCGDTATAEEVFDLFIKELTATRTKSVNSVATSDKKKTLEDHEIA